MKEAFEIRLTVDSWRISCNQDIFVLTHLGSEIIMQEVLTKGVHYIGSEIAPIVFLTEEEMNDYISKL